jgi:hypothetical protein
MNFMADNCIDLHHNIRMEVYSQKDSFLMENFIKQGASSPELISMIQCRNFFRVSRMSEVALVCGSRILLRMYNGDAPESDATSQCPIQPRPPKGAWTIWKKYMGFMVMSQTTLVLRHPWGNGKRNHPGLRGNIMNRQTVCISSIAKEPQNITVFEEPPGTVETEDSLINYSHSRNPPYAPARTHGRIQAPREPPN